MLYIADGGHLLHSVMWPKNCTYDDVINNYVLYGVTNYGNEAIVCFNSTKFAEQCRRTTGKNVAPDILLELQLPVTCSQTAFQGNHKNKSRFISARIASLTHSDIKCSQSQAAADFLICNSAIELAEESIVLLFWWENILIYWLCWLTDRPNL